MRRGEHCCNWVGGVGGLEHVAQEKENSENVEKEKCLGIEEEEMK